MIPKGLLGIIALIAVSTVHAQFTPTSPPGTDRQAPITLPETIFTLYNRQNPQGTRVIPWDPNTLTSGGFDAHKKTVLCTHGFLASTQIEGQLEMKKAHLDNLDVNYITVDWSACANRSLLAYATAKDCALKVGGFIAEFIKFLQANGASPKNMQAIGHSLGAHAMSQLSNYNVMVAEMFCLDPTQVLFWHEPVYNRLDPGDADFVSVIHTNVNAQGWNMNLGHADFYPNGGDWQPECGFHGLDIGCNHEKAYSYYARSLYNPRRYPATQCRSRELANAGQCRGPNNSYMGVLSKDGPPGVYYVDVRGR